MQTRFFIAKLLGLALGGTAQVVVYQRLGDSWTLQNGKGFANS